LLRLLLLSAGYLEEDLRSRSCTCEEEYQTSKAVSMSAV
jgi:hypothetical protein